MIPKNCHFFQILILFFCLDIILGEYIGEVFFWREFLIFDKRNENSRMISKLSFFFSAVLD